MSRKLAPSLRLRLFCPWSLNRIVLKPSAPHGDASITVGKSGTVDLVRFCEVFFGTSFGSPSADHYTVFGSYYCASSRCGPIATDPIKSPYGGINGNLGWMRDVSLIGVRSQRSEKTLGGKIRKKCVYWRRVAHLHAAGGQGGVTAAIRAGRSIGFDKCYFPVASSSMKSIAVSRLTVSMRETLFLYETP